MKHFFLSVAAALGAVASLSASDAPHGFVPAAFVHRALADAVGHTAVADLDLDGDLDIVLNGFWFETPADVERGDYGHHEIDAKCFNQKTGLWPDNATYVRVADLNRDGLPDIVICHSEKVGYPISWYSVDSLAQARTGPWREHTIAAVFDWCETLDVGDIDNDGTLDVLAAKFPRHDPPGGRWANDPPYPVSVFYSVAGDGSKWTRQDLALDGAYAAML